MDYYGILFVSRHKDNRDVEGYHERRHGFLTTKSVDELMHKFHQFVQEGVTGETSRFYRSINTRDIEKVRKGVITRLVNDDDFNLCHMDSLVISVAAKPQNALTKYWLFDVDTEDEKEQFEIYQDIAAATNAMKIGEMEFKKGPYNYPVYFGIRLYKTPHGLAIVTYDHFDTRALIEKWEGKLELKRDGLQFVAIETKSQAVSEE